MAKGQIVVDFSKANSTGGRIRLPEGDYKVKVRKVSHDTSKNGNPMLIWDFEIIEGKHRGKVLHERTMLMENSYWRLKQLLEAMGITVPSKRVALDLARYPGKELGVTVVDDEPYEGRINSKISDYVDIDVVGEEDEDEDVEEDEEDEEEEPAPKKAKKGKKKKQQVEEEIEDLDLDEI